MQARFTTALAALAGLGWPSVRAQTGPVAADPAVPVAAAYIAIRTVAVPDLSNPDTLTAFRSLARDVCGPDFPVRTSTLAAPTPAGTFVDQDPSAGSRTSCQAGVAIRYSGGPAPPPSFAVGLLAEPAAIKLLAVRVRLACGSGLAINHLTRASSRPAGDYDGQDPAPNAAYVCGETVSVWRSSGPTPPPPTPTPTPSPPAVPWSWIATGGAAVLAVIGGGAALISRAARPGPSPGPHPNVVHYAIRVGHARWTTAPGTPIGPPGARFRVGIGEARWRTVLNAGPSPGERS